MDINKKSRTELKAYFVKNAIPTESNFGDFIDAMVNQKDDGLTKSAGSPLCVEASNTGEQPVVQLYENFATAQAPNWVLSLLPGVTANSKTTGRGFSIGNGTGAANARLFIEQATGNLAIGAVDPAGYTVNLAGTMNVSGAVSINGSLTVASGQALNANGVLNANAGLNVAAGQALNANGVLNANAGLNVAVGQLLNANGVLNANAGLNVAVGQLLNANGILNANGGLTVAAGQVLTANGPLIANAGATVAGGRLNANAGLTVASGQSLVANGAFSATAGAGVAGGLLTATAGATVSGGLLTASSGATVSGAVLTANAGAIINGGLLTAGSGATVNGAIFTANAGAAVNGGLLTAGSGATVSGALLTANSGATINGSLLTANAGLTVSAGLLTANVGATVNGAVLTANVGAIVNLGPLTANAGASINGTLLTANAGLTVAAGLLSANAGATVGGAQLIANAGATINGSLLTVNAGATVSAGLLSANAGATVNGALLTANAGATVNGALLTANAGATVAGTTTTGTLTFPPPPGDPSPVITARTVPVGQGNANESTELILYHGNDGNNSSGPDYITLRAPGLRLQTYNDTSVLDINNNGGSNTRFYIDPVGNTTTYGPLAVGIASAAQPLTVTGTTTLTGLLNATGGATVTGLTTTGTLTFPPPPGDPSPVITARTVPVGQGNANESTELILYHGNDGTNGAGPDYITLRAPGLRFQTYNDASIGDINNNGGSNTRLYIDPNGVINAYGSLEVASTIDVQPVPRGGTHPTGLALYVTANSQPSSAGVEFRHTNGSQGIGFGYNTIYATGSNTDQPIFIVPRGAARVDITQEVWQTPALLNGWAYYGQGYNPPGYYRDSSCGTVHLRGLFTRGTMAAAIFMLPAGYRPQNRELLICCTYDTQSGRVDILTDGTVYATGAGSSGNWYCLDGVTFRAYQ